MRGKGAMRYEVKAVILSRSVRCGAVQDSMVRTHAVGSVDISSVLYEQLEHLHPPVLCSFHHSCVSVLIHAEYYYRFRKKDKLFK
jgi:hypothetical protein